MSNLWSKGQAALRSIMTTTFGSRTGKYLVGEVGDLQDGQMKEVPIEVNGRQFKVLLSRIHGQYYATSHLCSHYKARLVTGTLSSNGRLVCPWHAACFNVITGDIEEAPAIDALRTFQVVIEAEKVYVLAEPFDFENPTRSVCEKFNPNDSTRSSEVFVIVGGGAAGAVAAESIRQAGFDGKVMVISKEPHLPIDRIKLSKFLTAECENILIYKPDYLDQIKVDYRLGMTVLNVDIKNNMLSLDNGEKISYNKLLLATGGEPRRLPITGIDLENVITIRTINNNERIIEAIKKYEKPNVVIIGASFIGMEVASMLRKVSQSVTIVAPENVPLERALGPEIGGVFRRLAERNGVAFRLGVGLKALLPRDHNEKQVVGFVELIDQSKLEADIVILGVGVRPQTDCVKDSLPLESDQSIAVDKYLRVIGTENVYAAGDIAKFPHYSSGSPVRIEHWDVALQQGRVAGYNMATILKESLKPYDSVPFFFTMIFGKSVRYSGDTHEGYDDIFIDGDILGDNPVFAAYFIKGLNVVAVATMGRDPLAVHCGELFLQRRMLSAEEIRMGKSPMNVSI